MFQWYVIAYALSWEVRVCYICKHALNDNSTEMFKHAYNYKRLLTVDLATDVTKQGRCMDLRAISPELELDCNK